MDYRQLTGTGFRVSAVGLGTNIFGRYVDEALSARIIHRALELGVNMIDTADSYALGVSETFIGKALAGRRNDVFLASKTGFPLGKGPNDHGISYRRVVNNCEAILRRLNTDYLDLFYLHRPDPLTPLEESLRACDDLVRQGKVRYVGISNHSAWQVCEALWICDRRGYQKPVVTQNLYNVLEREIEAELVPFCRAHKMGIVPFYPLAGGVLTGKYRFGETVQPGVRGYENPVVKQHLTEQILATVQKLDSFARERERTVGALAIAWLLAQPHVPSIIPSATKLEQLEANIAAADWKLTPDDLKAIDAIIA